MNLKKATSTIVSLIVVVTILSSFGLMSSKVAVEQAKEPNRSENIPVSAEWYPRSACQIWIDFHELDPDNNSYRISIYGGESGVIGYSGWFEISENFEFWADIKNKLLAYDGEVIYLTDGRELHPV